MTEHLEPDVLDRIVEITRNLVEISSTPCRPDDRRQCYAMVRNHLEAMANIEVCEYESGGIPSLVATPVGIPHPEVLLLAHLDVVAHPNDDAYRSRLADGRIVGPGAGDMKGALAILLEAFRHVHGRAPGASVGIAVTADEETGGEHGVRYLFEEVGLRCGVALIPDGGCMNRITVEEKGLIHVRLTCEGHSAHAARPWLGKNAVQIMMDGLSRVRARFGNPDENDNWHPTCAVTVFHTENRTTNRIPSHAEATLDIRYLLPQTVEEIICDVRRALGDDIEAEIVIQSEPTHLAPDPLYREITEAVTGLPAELVRCDGSSDARYILAHDIPVLMSRPRVGNLHAEDEWIDIESMGQFYRIVVEYLERRLELPKPTS